MHNDRLITASGATGSDIAGDTRALQKAIDECSAQGGGRVVVPPGVFVVGSFELKSGVTLHLSENAVLRASADRKDYRRRRSFNAITGRYFFNFDEYLVYAKDARTIAITGRGTIDGNGRAFFLEHSRCAYGRKDVDGWRPGPLVMLESCTDVLLRDVNLLDSPAYTVLPLGCEHVLIDNVTIRNDRFGPNTDGIGLHCCRDVRISNCSIVAGDDCVCCYSMPLWLASQRPCENVTVTNCTLSSVCCGIRIGFAPTDLPIRNLVFTGLVMHDTSTGISLLAPLDSYCRIPCDPVARHGPIIENIVFDGIVMDVEEMIYWWHDNEVVSPAGIRNISLSNVIASSRYASFIGGSKAVPVRDIRLSNIRLSVDSEKRMVCGYTRGDEPEAPDDPPDPSPAWGKIASPHALYLRHVENVSLSNVEVVAAGGGKPWRSALRAVDANGLWLTGLRCRGLANGAAQPFQFVDTSDLHLSGCFAQGKAVRAQGTPTSQE